MGRLFEPISTHRLLHDLEEVTELVISRFILTSALSNNASATSEMDQKLHMSWMYFQAELNDSLNKIESSKAEGLMAGDLYSRYQQEIYHRIYNYHPDTLEELQITMEQVRTKYDIQFPNEGWPIERCRRENPILPSPPLYHSFRAPAVSLSLIHFLDILGLRNPWEP